MNGGASVGNDREQKISVKINGEEQSFSEKSTKSNIALTKLNHIVYQNEAASTKEVDNNDEFQWVLPKDNVSNESTYNSVNKTTKSKKKQLSNFKNSGASLNLQFFLVIFIAIMIGLGFGLFILHFVSKDVAVQGNISELNSADSLKDADETKKSTQQQLETVSHQLMPLTLYVIQAGAFSNLDAATQFAESIKGSSVPIAYFNKEKVYIFIGVGTNEEVINTIGSQYQLLDIEIYKKLYMVEGKTISIENKSASENLERASELFEKLITVSSEEAAGKPIQKDVWEEIEANYKMTNFSLFENHNEMKKFTDYVNQAYQYYVKYRTNHSETQLYQTQQALLQALATYELF